MFSPNRCALLKGCHGRQNMRLKEARFQQSFRLVIQDILKFSNKQLVCRFLPFFYWTTFWTNGDLQKHVFLNIIQGGSCSTLAGHNKGGKLFQGREGSMKLHIFLLGVVHGNLLLANQKTAVKLHGLFQTQNCPENKIITKPQYFNKTFYCNIYGLNAPQTTGLFALLSDHP